MNVHALCGDLTSALSHFASVGLTAILADGATHSGHGDPEAKVCWSDDIPSQPLLFTSLDSEGVADVVHRHAERHTRPPSWVQSRVAVGVRSGGALFSPRIKACPAEELPAFEVERQTALAAATGKCQMSELDWWMLAGLGEPAWWRYNPKDSDDGASRWEMITRTAGKEFVTHRLAPLAGLLAGRTLAEVWDGLSGRVVTDELGKNRVTSRTATGFTSPGPTDTALAWCALWGISLVPTTHRVLATSESKGMSQSPGVWPRDRENPRVAAVPVFISPVSPSRFRSVLSAARFDIGAFGHLMTRNPDVTAAKEWLGGQGVRAIVRFPIHLGNGQSPERQLLDGEVEPL